MITLPKNDASTCWWLSTNLALFHRRRPELDYFFSTPEMGTVGDPRSLLGPVLKGNFNRIYRHYTNQAPIPPGDLIALRLAPGMAEKFNSGGDDGFQVDGEGFQDASEYILKLKGYLEEAPVALERLQAYRAQRTVVDRAERAAEADPESGEAAQAVVAAQDEEQRLLRLASPAPYPTMGFLEINVADTNKDYFDFYVHQLYKGFNRRSENVGARQRLIRQANSLTDTFIVFFNRTQFTPEGERIARDDPVAVLKSITIPLADIPDGHHPDLVTYPLDPPGPPVPAVFELDSIVVNIPGHYYSYVRCGDTEEWLRYYAMGAGKLTMSFPSLDALLAKYERDASENISRRATMLIYHRVR
jgi:hypothetical protein